MYVSINAYTTYSICSLYKMYISHCLYTIHRRRKRGARGAMAPPTIGKLKYKTMVEKETNFHYQYEGTSWLAIQYNRNMRT